MAMFRRLPVLVGLVLLTHHALAIPLGYRYVGSRVVSEGRHVLWYWNSDYFETDPAGTAFVARLYARNVEQNEERPFVAIIRCGSRSYRRMGSSDPYEAIEDGDPIFAVWRAGCDGAQAISLAARNDRLNGTTTAAAPAPAPPVPSDKSSVAAAAPADARKADPRRVDRCIRFVENRVSQFGDAAITNTCNYAIEVVYCYKGGRGGAFDCPAPPRRMRADSLGPGATHNLPEYKHGRNSGIALVACRGAMGTVIPQLNTDGGKTGCQ